MDTYKSFAGIYDDFMWDADYDMWVEYLYKIWDMYGEDPKLLYVSINLSP